MAAPAPPERSLRTIIVASSLGTLFEWYDFYLYGTLAIFFGDLFFPKSNGSAGLLESLALFGAGFVVRPLGALFFGRIGDLVGRKYTFLVTILTMGLSTALIGFLPTYEQVGLLAPLLLLILRLLQGLALGGEYGGAATYVAEHVPDDRRGYYTSYIQTTATLGFFLSLGVIGAARAYFGPAAFKAHGWRVPFVLSIALVAISLYVRLKLSESPLYAKLKAEGRVSKSPLRESFGNPRNRKYVLLALFGATAGQAVVWYTGQFYALTFLQKSLGLDWPLAYAAVACALALTTPLFVTFGRLSDRIGRKRLILASCLLAALTYVPIYMGLRAVVNPAFLPKVVSLSAGAFVALVALLALQMVYVTMCYGPIAAFLVELFPTSIRYTSMSLPYHVGNGVFGGFLPFIATALTASTWAKTTFGAGAQYAGLIYPIAVALLTVVVGGLFVRETKDHKIDAAV